MAQYKIINGQRIKIAGGATVAGGYKVGDVYETLSTSETTTTLATRFGGTWEAISDRKEWDEKDHSWESGAIVSHLSSNGIVTFTVSLTVPINYKYYGAIDWDKPKLNLNINAQLGANAYITIQTDGGLSSYNGSGATQDIRGTSSFLTQKTADRTFKRFKRTA